MGWLRKELEQFPDEATCFAYEGEDTGIVVNSPPGMQTCQGFIYCSGAAHDPETETLEQEIARLNAPPAEPPENAEKLAQQYLDQHASEP